MSFTSYFEVSGQRKYLDEVEGEPPAVRMQPHHVRYVSVLQESAVAFAQDVYKRENIICEIHEKPCGAVSA